MTFKELLKLAEDCYESLDRYEKNLKDEVEKAMHKAIDTQSAKTLRDIKTVLDLTLYEAGHIRFRLKQHEKTMRGIIKGITKEHSSLCGEKAPVTFYHPTEKINKEDARCPFCRKINKKFNYGELCTFCSKKIHDPWKEHTECPYCRTSINRSEIYGDKEAYALDTKTNDIKCDNCEHVFNWKKYRREPTVFGLKFCIACDMPYIPDKRNYRKQLICPLCKDKGVDSHKLEDPEYYSNYRKQNKKVT